MKRVIQRTYVDTSVFGGAFDEEFEIPSKMFFHSPLEIVGHGNEDV